MARKNTEGMIKKRQEESAAKKVDISIAIDKLVKDKKLINISSVARQAKCSKNTVRKHQDLMTRIEGLREIQSTEKGSAKSRQRNTKNDNRTIALYELNKELKHKVDRVITQLIDQTELEIEIDRLKSDNARLIKKITLTEAMNFGLKKQLEELTSILEKNRESSVVLSLVSSNNQEVSAQTAKT
jgi:hypothetical protein